MMKDKDKRIAELEKTLREFEQSVRNENELLEMQKNQDERDLEQQAKGIESAIDAALDLGLIENDVLVCKSIREQAKGGAK